MHCQGQLCRGREVAGRVSLMVGVMWWLFSVHPVLTVPIHLLSDNFSRLMSPIPTVWVTSQLSWLVPEYPQIKIRVTWLSSRLPLVLPSDIQVLL